MQFAYLQRVGDHLTSGDRVLPVDLDRLQRNFIDTVSTHEFEILRDLPEVGPHDDKEGIEEWHRAAEPVLPGLDAADVGQDGVEIGADAHAGIGGWGAAIDGDRNVAERSAHDAFGPRVVDHGPVGADTNHGAADGGGDVVEQIAEAGESKEFPALHTKS